MRGSSSKICHIFGKWMADCCRGVKCSSVKSDQGAVSIFGRSLVSSARAIVRTSTLQPSAVTGRLNNLGWMQLRFFRHMTFPPRHQPWGPLSSAGRRWLNLNETNVIWALIAANGAVFMLWRIDPYFATKHFVVSLESLRSGRIWTALTASFSQQDFGHLASNMISLYFFGSDIGRMFGGRTLLLMYVAGGIVGSLAHCLWSYYQQKLARSKSAYHGFGYLVSRGALGASAAVNAIVMFDILLFPTRTILLYGIIPLPAALLGLLWFWNDVGGALSGSNSFPSIAYAGHLGGAAVGLSFWLAFRRGRLSPRSWW